MSKRVAIVCLIFLGLALGIGLSGVAQRDRSDHSAPVEPQRILMNATNSCFADSQLARLGDGQVAAKRQWTGPAIAGVAGGGEVDEQCEFVATLVATVTDDCGVAAGDVTVQVAETTGNATLGVPVINLVQNGVDAVEVSVSVLVSDLTASPAEVRFGVSALDNCGLQTNHNFFVLVEDNIPPTLEVSLDPDRLWPPNHKMIDIDAEVIAEDNCGVVNFVLDSVVSDEPDDHIGDGSFVDDIQGVVPGTPDVTFRLRAKRAMEGDGRTYAATYTATDASGNQATESATVEVPANQSN